MSSESVIESLCDTTTSLLKEALKCDKETQIALILQTKNFFQQIFNTLTGDSPSISHVYQACHTLFQTISFCINDFL